MSPSTTPSHLPTRFLPTLLLILLLALAMALGRWWHPVAGLLPPTAALAVILVMRRALWGLLAGSLVGAVLLHGGNPVQALVRLLPEHLLPGLTSPWKLGALAFTLLLGGFAGLLEAGGGFRTLVRRLEGSAGDAASSSAPFSARRRVRLETALAGLGLLCFFDGLANSMVVGRVGRGLTDAVGTARVKLAYIADTTSSAVACVAFISTWIAFQLGMIAQAFAQAGLTVNPYQVFLRSVPLNFYCWFSLILLAVAVRRQYHPGPMGACVAAHSSGQGAPERMPAAVPPGTPEGQASPASALVPLAVLLVAFLLGFVLLGTQGPLLPLTRDKLVAAFGSDRGPLVMVLAALAGSLAGFLVFPRRGPAPATRALRAFAGGLGGMVLPLFILLAAWMLGSVVSALGTADLLAHWAGRTGSLPLFPTLVFLTGAVVSFATGTSWGTMGLLFPLLVPAAAQLGAGPDMLTQVVAAIFSGAVFGDHCSPFSDTTIITSLSCGVTPHDHVRTQLPYALIAAVVAVGAGFLPAGFGLSPWLSLAGGTLVLLLLPRLKKP